MLSLLAPLKVLRLSPMPGMLAGGGAWARSLAPDELEDRSVLLVSDASHFVTVTSFAGRMSPPNSQSGRGFNAREKSEPSKGVRRLPPTAF